MPISQQEKDNLLGDINSQYSIPIDVLPPAMQMQPDVMSGALVSPVGETPIQETDELAISSYLQQEAPDIGLSVYGGLKGAKMGKPFGALGQVLGGVLGGVVGSTTGKMAQETPEYRAVINEPEIPEEEKYSVLGALTQSGLEELGGRVISGVTAPVTQKAYQGVKRLGDYLTAKGINPFGKSQQQIQFEDALVDYSYIDPTIKEGDNIRVVQERVFGGEKPLTAFEETGGKMGAGLQNLLLDKTSQEGRLSNIPTFYEKERAKYINQLQKHLVGDDALKATDRVTFDALQSTLRDTRNKLDGAVDSASKKMRESGRNIQFNLFDFKERVKDSLPDLEKLGVKEGREIYKDVNSLIDKFTSQKSNTVNATKFLDLKKSIENLKGKFSESKEAQAEVAGVISDVINPVIDDVITKNKIVYGNNEKFSTFFEQVDDFTKKAKDRRAFLDSRVVKKLGSKEYRQDKDTLTPKTLSKFVFKDKENYKAVTDMLADKPELLEKINAGLKADVFKDIFNSEAKEFNYSALKKKLNDPEFVDIANQIGGKKYVQSLYDTALIQHAYNQTAKATSTGLLPSQKIGQNLTRYLVHPLAGRIGLSSAILSGARKSLGLGSITDEQMYKFMKSTQGQKVIQDTLNSPLNTPEGYNGYVQLVRELGKAGYEDINLLAAPAFALGVGEIVGTTIEALTPEMVQNFGASE